MRDSADFDHVNVFFGSQPEVLSVSAALEAHGLHPFTLADNIKTIDPFITGGNVFEITLQVPRCEVEEALRLIRELKIAAPQDGAADEEVEITDWADYDAPDGEDEDAGPEGEEEDAGPEA